MHMCVCICPCIYMYKYVNTCHTYIYIYFYILLYTCILHIGIRIKTIKNIHTPSKFQAFVTLPFYSILL